MKNDWNIKFKVIDRNARWSHKKSVLSNISIDVPTEMVLEVVQLIAKEVDRLNKLSLDKPVKKKK